jgi:ribokinase
VSAAHHLRLAVVGHIEWIRFARVDHVPAAGGIAHALEAWEGAGGGGAVAAVQLGNLGGSCLFLSALGDDRVGEDEPRDRVGATVDLRAAVRVGAPTRTALTMIEAGGERTILTLGERLEASGDDDLPWDELASADGVLFTAGDAEALRMARRARVLVAASRHPEVLARAGVALDAIVGSALDPAERIEHGALHPPPRLAVRTEGAQGGTWETDTERGRYEAAVPPGPIVDTYGAGDCFQAGLTFGLASGLDATDAIALAARCGAYAVSGRGPTGGQLRATDLA